MSCKTHKGMYKRIKKNAKKSHKKSMALLHYKAGGNHLLVNKGKSQRKSPSGRSFCSAEYKKVRALLRI